MSRLILRQLSIFFAEILHAGRAAIDMTHIKRDFSLKAWVRAPGVDFRAGAEAKIKLFQNIVRLNIKLKLTTFLLNGSKHFAHRLTLDQGVMSKGQTIYFCESSHVAYQIKGN